MIDDRMVERLKRKMDEEWGTAGREFVPRPPITHDGETVHRCLLLKAMADRGNPRLTSPPILTLIQGGKRD